MFPCACACTPGSVHARPNGYPAHRNRMCLGCRESTRDITKPFRERNEGAQPIAEGLAHSRPPFASIYLLLHTLPGSVLSCSVHPMSARPGASPKLARLYTPHSLNPVVPCNDIHFRTPYIDTAIGPCTQCGNRSILGACPTGCVLYFACSGEVIRNSVSVDHPPTVDSEGDTAAQSGSSFRWISATRPKFFLFVAAVADCQGRWRGSSTFITEPIPSACMYSTNMCTCVLHYIALHCIASALRMFSGRPGISGIIGPNLLCSHGQPA